jgi:hypothetical protein
LYELSSPLPASFQRTEIKKSRAFCAAGFFEVIVSTSMADKIIAIAIVGTRFVSDI